jgi:hypothetical protein
MMKKKYNRYTSFLDRFPFIIVAIILVIAIIFIFQFKAKIPLKFFSGGQTQQTEVTAAAYSILITSPTNDQVFNFVNKNESVPVIIKSKDIEKLDYKLKLVINNEDTIKTFSTPPYEYNWNPAESGEYEIVANLVDNSDKVIASSNKISFTVQYEGETSESIPRSVDIEAKKQEALDKSNYRTQSGVPIFCFKCYTIPTIDGSISEWEVFDKISIATPTIKKENFTNLKDCSGVFYSCWDDNNFYFAVQVVDDVFNQPFTGNQINKGDSITMVFDTDLNGDFQIPFYNSDDMQVDFSPGNFKGIPAEAYINFPATTPKGVSVASTRLAGGYIIEGSIPWSDFISYGPKDEDVLGFTVSIFDTDNLDSTELVMSSSNQFELNNVTTLGTIVLIDGGDLQSEATGESTTGSSESTTTTTEKK